jgi:hypothetical protein
MALWPSFQQSAILSVASLSILESQFSLTWQRQAILRGKGDSGLSFPGIDEIPVSHLTETEKCRKVNLIRQSHLTNFKLLKMVFCSYCDGVPLKCKKKNGRASSVPARII